MVDLFPPGSAILGTLEYADCMFFGNGPEGMPCPIGVERKAIRDLVNSMGTGRLSGHQLPGLSANYQWVYLIIEGIWRYNPSSGLLEIRSGGNWEPLQFGSRRYMCREVIGFLNTIAVKTGVIVMYSGSKRETAQVIHSLFNWWNNKQWDEHMSHLLPNKSHRGPHGEVELIKPPIVRRMASEIPGIGWGKSKGVGEKFSTPAEMIMADEKTWRSIPGIGKKLAQGIMNALHGNAYKEE